MLSPPNRMVARMRVAWLATLLALLCAGGSAAQQVEGLKIFEKRPFDRITLNAANQNAVLEVRRLDLPGRRVPDPLPSGRFEVRLVSKPGQPYELLWSSVAKVDLFEQMIMAEAVKLTSEKKFDEAFDYFQRLHKSFPETPGLANATSEYLQRNAFATFEDGDYDRALAILASLYQRQPGFAGLNRAVDRVADQIIQGHLKQRDLRTARGVLDVVGDQFQRLDLTVVDRWRTRFQAEADARVRTGAKAFEAKDYRTARTAAAQALAIWPEHKQASQLEQLVQRANPTVIVGVRTAAARPLEPRLDSPASLRAGFLAAPTLTRITDYSAEGGVYASPIGSVGLDATGRELAITVLDYPRESAAALDAPAAVARWLLRAATPASKPYRPALARVLGAVSTPEPDILVMALSRTHVRPEALLHDVSLEDCQLAPPFGVFRVVPTAGSAANNSPDGQTAAPLEMESINAGSSIAVVEERPITDDGQAIAALTGGDIDVLDRVPPWQLSVLRAKRELNVGEYRLPTVHVLVPTHAQKLLDNREFRRALCYGLDRERILNELILGGNKSAGFQVVSGPFPAGKGLTDGVRYAYNDAIEPRPYEPRLAALLATLSWTNLQRAEQKAQQAAAEGEAGEGEPTERAADPASEEDPPEPLVVGPIPTLRLAHSSDPVARTACGAIQQQLRPLGITIELTELSNDALLDPEGDFDLRYVELSAWEPVVDAMRLLGPGGLAGRCSDPMYEALKRLDEARNWREALTTLRDIHELAAGDLPVIPLWQTVNHYAYRRDLAGLPPTTIHLYQTLTDWRKQFEVASR